MINKGYPIFLFWMLLLGCRNQGPDIPPRILNLSQGTVGLQFLLHRVGPELHVLYADRESLSLRMLILSSVETDRPRIKQTFFLDRISDTPEVDFSFDQLLYLTRNNGQHVFYIDHQGEGNKILKWISKGFTADNWWIDIVPDQGRPLAVFASDQERLELLLHKEATLYLQRVGEQHPSIPILHGFRPQGDITVLSGPGIQGFTAFDEISGELLLIRRHREGLVTMTNPATGNHKKGRSDIGAPLGRNPQPSQSYRVEHLGSAGKIHFAALNGHAGLQLLFYDTRRKALIFRSRDQAGGKSFERTVTLCHGTHSVYFFLYRDKPWFLFDEVSLDGQHRKHYQLSLLYPRQGGYDKARLLSGPVPIYKFKAVFVAGILHIALAQEALRLVSVDLSALLSIQNHDL